MLRVIGVHMPPSNLPFMTSPPFTSDLLPAHTSEPVPAPHLPTPPRPFHHPSQGRKLNDIGGGQPAFIVADVHSTAAILRAAKEASPDDFYHSSKLILYFDEPTMGESYRSWCLEFGGSSLACGRRGAFGIVVTVRFVTSQWRVKPKDCRVHASLPITTSIYLLPSRFTHPASSLAPMPPSQPCPLSHPLDPYSSSGWSEHLPTYSDTCRFPAQASTLTPNCSAW